MVRKDLTISLEEEFITRLLEIAEKRGITLSSLIREIITSYCTGQVVKQAPIGTLSDEETARISVSSGVGSQDLVSLKLSYDRICEQLTHHLSLIDDCRARISQLEHGSGVNSDIHPRVSSPVPLSEFGSESPVQGGVIDSDMQMRQGQPSEEALVKVPLRPASPVMTAVEYGSAGSIVDGREYSMTETAVYLNLSVSTIRKYVKEGRIPARRIGRSWFFQGKDIRAFLNSR